MKQFLLFALSSLLFLSFVFFSYLVHEDVFIKGDFDTTVKLQDNLPERLIRPFSTLSELGNFETLLIALVVLLVVRRKVFRGLFVIFLFGMFHIFELFGKTYVKQPPPPEFMLKIDKLIDFPQFHVRSEFSYPSGHAGRTAFLSVILIAFILSSKKIPDVFKFPLVAVVAGFDFVMFVSRPYLGEHWATDVVGGALLGFSLGLLSLFSVRSLFKKN